MRPKFWRQATVYLVLFAACLFFLMPLIVMILTSFKSLEEVRSGHIFSWPKHFTLDSYRTAWSEACIGSSCEGMGKFFINSLLFSIPATLISALIGSLNGLALTKWSFKGANALFVFLLMGCFIPLQSIIIPLTQLINFFDIENTLFALILVHVVYGIGFTTLNFRNFYLDFPIDIIRAAKMDGAGFWTIYTRIVLPLSKPIFIVTVIWQFTYIWNDYLFGVVLTSGDNQPITVALYNLVSSTTGVKAYNVDMAASFLTAWPTLIIYFLASKFFVKGLMAGSVKG
jgi:glucose/mannose transport system permease protein